jgi:hypothetical protein
MPAVTNSHRIADTAIGQAQAINLADIAGERGFVLKRSGHELVGPCPLCGGVDRFAVNVTKGLYHCRDCGVGGRGAIAFVRWLDDAGFRDAVETLTGGRNDQINGLAVDLVRATADRDRRQHEKARWLWSQRQRITGSIAEAYLREARGITCALPPTLGFLQPRKADQHPAMIAAFGLCAEIEPGIIAAPSKVTAVHLTLLKTDGSGKAEIKPNKIMIGSPGGLPIIIAPPNDLLGLAITEGLEDA